MKLYHVTTAGNAASILEGGLHRGAYVTSRPELASYYAKGVVEDGEAFAAVVFDLHDLVDAVGEAALRPDRPSLQEPISNVIGKSAEAVDAEWTASARDWRASLRIVGSVRIDAPVPAGILRDCTAEIDARNAAVPGR